MGRSRELNRARGVVLAQEAHQNPLLNGKQIFSYMSKPLYRVLKYHAILKEIFGNVPEGYPARGIVCVSCVCVFEHNDVSCARVHVLVCVRVLVRAYVFRQST